jgi:3-hydroxyisobutyrate dehydrogenase
MNKVGIVGSGALARAVCWRLLECGHPVLVWGPDPSGVAECVRSGAATASTPSELASQSSVVIVAAEDGAESERWQLGDHGVVTGLAEGSVVVDMTTMSPSQSRRLARAYDEVRGGFLDAPVSGGAPAARTGNLVMMIGGPESAFDAVLPVLEPLGRVIVRMGETGAGSVAKLCNQVMCFVNLCGVCEAFTLGAKAGIDLKKLFGVVTAGAAQSWELDNMGPKILARDLATGYPVGTSQEDLSLVLAAARELKVFLPASSLVHQLYHTVETEGLTAGGSQSLIRALEKMSGVEVRG